MSDQNLGLEDVAAMRRQGDLKAFLRQSVKAGQQQQRANLRPAASTAAPRPGHRPGAWPASSIRNTPTVCRCEACAHWSKTPIPPVSELLRTSAESARRTA